MEKCPNCGGIFPLNSFVCGYCGYVESEKVKQLSETHIKEISFDESLKVIQDNLNTLHNINKPTVKNGIKAVLRIITAIHTLGIVLLFWKRPKNRFNKKSYNNLKNIIVRNIELLKVSSIGSDDLMRRIYVIERELERTDFDVKKNLKAKRLTTFIIVASYISLFVINGIENPILKHPIYPVKESVTGDLQDNLIIAHQVHKLSYYGGGNLEHFKMKVTLTSKEKFILNDNNELSVILKLTDSAGNESTDFYPYIFDNIDINTVEDGLKRVPEVDIILHIEIKEKRAFTEIPKNLTNFKIHTEIKNINK